MGDETFTPSADNETQALALVTGACNPAAALATLQSATVIVAFQGYAVTTRIQAAERLLEAANAAVSLLLPGWKGPVEMGVEALKHLPAESIAELEYALQTLLMTLKAKFTVVSQDSVDLWTVGKAICALTKDTDGVFAVDAAAWESWIVAMQRSQWSVAFSSLRSIALGSRPSQCISSLFVSSLSSIPVDDRELFPQLQELLVELIQWFDEKVRAQLLSFYAEVCRVQGQQVHTTLQVKEKLTFAQDLRALIEGVIENPTVPPATIKDDIKRVVMQHNIKEANEVFQSLRARFTQASSPKEVAGCMLVLKAVQLSKNLSAEKLTDLYNAIHKKRQPKEQRKDPHSDDEGEAAADSFLCDTLLFNPEDLPAILEKANRNAYAVVQAYMTKRSEFMKCVELFRLLGDLVKQDLPGYSVHTFGSLACGTWTKYSTVDITLCNPAVSEYVLPLSTLQSALKLHPDLKLEPVFKSKYPVLRVKRADSYFWVNITINNAMGLEVAKLMTRYCELDPRVPELIIFIKVWAHINGISQSKIGLPSGYSWSLLVLHFLMYIGVIPCLQARPHTPVMKEGCDVWVDEEKWEVTDKRSLGQLVMMFLYHYGVAVPQMDGALNLRTGAIHQIEPSPVLYPIIQPFEESRPLFTLHRSKDIGKKVVNCMRKTYNRLVQQHEAIRLN